MNEQTIAVLAIVTTLALFGGASIRCGYSHHIHSRDFITGVLTIIGGMMWLLFASWILFVWIGA